MAHRRPRRWRERRDTLPARRRKRRASCHDLPASSCYEPMEVDPRTAQRGVQVRLFWAMFSAMLTLGCIILGLTATLGTLGVAFALTVGLGSLGASVALLMSARREEMVHELASELNYGPFLEPGEDLELLEFHGADGQIGEPPRESRRPALPVATDGMP